MQTTSHLSQNATGRNHVFIVDGTFSSLEPGCETNAGLTYKLLMREGPLARQLVAYHRGVYGRGLEGWVRAATGEGVNDAILQGYATLASRWRPGDRIYLFGYSRGAYAVRSLAGMIDRIGLLRRRHAIERRVRLAFEHYMGARSDSAARSFSDRFCRRDVRIEAVCVWDTVAALGLPYPILSRIHPMATEFHDHRLGRHIRNGFHALALDETRTAFAPVMWERAPGWRGRLEQVWFAGAHADVGGQVESRPAARPLANIPLVWMLERAEACGLLLPEGWREVFPTDPAAPMVGTNAGIGKLFLLRRPRRFGGANGEELHESVARRIEMVPGYRPAAEGLAP
ncbi:DUF2235 domain-containing protein [Oceanicella actignis]|uniref:Uncharacterized protein, PA2063/DUF2235 family n=1 Tax=Oceanicella actignis TaxID=1189325 RepID=A0A1M7TKK9_9RHOB|nr:Uncharacterized protein, PA2063/DUF2235 family [Oceanicella actignis]SHN71245.1 Uncharacterized protein, PA2063/DUF2235 family [Oceanicella actignis]